MASFLKLLLLLIGIIAIMVPITLADGELEECIRRCKEYPRGDSLKCTKICNPEAEEKLWKNNMN